MTFELGDKKNAKKIYQSAQKYGFAAPLLKERMDALSPSKDASYEADSVALDTIVPPANIELDTATKPDTIVESLSPAAITKSDPPKSKYTLVLIAVLAIAGAIGSYLYGKRIMKKK